MYRTAGSLTRDRSTTRSSSLGGDEAAGQDQPVEAVLDGENPDHDTPRIEPYDGPPDKQRLIAAMRGEPTDRVPNFEVLIEDQHVERLLGRKAGNTLGVGGDPAKGSEAAEGVRPMYPQDYLELCRIIGQDAIVLENLWTPIKQRKPDGTHRRLERPQPQEPRRPGADRLARRARYRGAARLRPRVRGGRPGHGHRRDVPLRLHLPDALRVRHRPERLHGDDDRGAASCSTS